MEFIIKVIVDFKPYKMNVVRILETAQVEKFLIIAGNKKIILRNNRPLLKSKGHKIKKPVWKIDEGNATSMEGLSLTILAIEKKIKEIEDLCN